jgi:protein disulfide-isomerase
MVLNYLLLCAAFVSQVPAETPSGSAGLKWESDLETAQRQSRESGRLLLIHFGGPWCEPCRRLENQVFNQPGFGRDLNTRFVAVKVDPHEHPELAKQFNVRAVPTDVVMTASGQVVKRMESPASVAAYNEALHRVTVSVQPSADVAAAGAPAPARDLEQSVSHDPLDRYADYYNRREPVPPPSQSAEKSPSTGAVRPAAPRPPSIPSSLTQAKPANPPLQQPQPEPSSQNPPVALDGYCAVTLVEKRQWNHGDDKWGAIHRGRTYLFVSQEAQQAFLADPDRYSPVFSGNDPVIRVEHNKMIPGKREHGAFYEDRIYLFASEDAFEQFKRDPSRYIVETSRQARRR